MTRANATHAQVGAVLIDLDFFKDINDIHGHAVGDEILVAVGQALSLGVRAEDVLARTGGEEFLLLCVVETPADAAEIGARVHTTIRQLRGPVPVTCSVGVAVAKPTVKDSGDDPDRVAEWIWSLAECADRAMYQAKLGGRDQVALAVDGPGQGVIPAGEPSVPVGETILIPRQAGRTRSRRELRLN